jgi:hypothetical protein
MIGKNCNGNGQVPFPSGQEKGSNLFNIMQLNPTLEKIVEIGTPLAVKEKCSESFITWER